MEAVRERFTVIVCSAPNAHQNTRRKPAQNITTNMAAIAVAIEKLNRRLRMEGAYPFTLEGRLPNRG
jgi:hypothetical protein